ncbi:MAG: hypothetical protein VXX02_10220 [Pseudomonadota bacterium]|nr:hypothetical protein [Pseudomonadota bacterium]MEC7107229.1 hypothetical protein [Pseudomonadota bacterium]MEC7419896.1 hypothetical protein [Pseudomonadota bacterium]MEC7554038.1 hypothetical protein [Pseudomonadota bacterium]MEC7781414.1 hypothetical protein [Pseudomonadota bacterium]
MGEDWEVNHVGMTIGNRNAALRHFQSIGVGVSVGPQPLLPYEPGEGSLMFYRTLEGDPVTNTYTTGGAHTFNDGESQIGDCQLECYPMRPGPGMFLSEYLARKGPGINHICFNTASVEADTQFFLQKGCALMFNALVNGKTVENYLDTRTHGDLMISLRPPATDWEKAWKANNEAHPLVNPWRFLGVGIGVKDLAATVAYYADIGFPEATAEITDEAIGSVSQSVSVGPISFDFFAAASDASIYSQSLELRGDGVNDISFAVADLEYETARLQEKGVAWLGTTADGNSRYFDTRGEGNIMLRLVQP